MGKKSQSKNKQVYIGDLRERKDPWTIYRPCTKRGAKDAKYEKVLAYIKRNEVPNNGNRRVLRSLLQNVPADERKEVQLVSSLVKKEPIKVPCVEQIPSTVYDRMYQEVFDKMPPQLQRKEPKDFWDGLSKLEKRLSIKKIKRSKRFPYVKLEIPESAILWKSSARVKLRCIQQQWQISKLL